MGEPGLFGVFVHVCYATENCVRDYGGARCVSKTGRVF
jgi:hypothetical protein